MITITIMRLQFFGKSKNRTAYCNPAELSLKGLFNENPRSQNSSVFKVQFFKNQSSDVPYIPFSAQKKSERSG